MADKKLKKHGNIDNVSFISGKAPAMPRRILEIFILMVIYIVTARVGQLMAISPGNVTPVWIPSGIILAAVLLRGYWIWPGIFLGAFLGNTWAYFDAGSFFQIGITVFSGLLNGAGDVLCAVVAAYLINKTAKTKEIFDKSAYTALFILFGFIVGPLISAIFGVGGLCLAKIVMWEKFLYTFATWLTGDGVGALVLAPALITLFNKEYRDFHKNKLIEVILFPFVLIGITILCMTNHYFIGIHTSLFLIVPVFLWASFRLGRFVTFHSIVLTSAILIYCTVKGYGPFVDTTMNKTLVELQFFITIMTVTIFMLTSIITERKRSGYRIRKLSQALHQSPTSVLITDINGNIEYVNPQFTTTTGYSPEEVLGRNPAFLISEKQSHTIYTEIVDTIKIGNEWRGDLLNKMKNGNCIRELVSILPVKDENGSITNFVGVKIDDTERIIAEKELRKSSSNLIKAQHIAHIGNWVWDITNNKIEWSDEIYNIFGVNKNDFDCSYESFIDLVHPDDRELVKKSVNDALYKDAEYSIEHRIIRPDGTVRIALEQGEVTFNNEGNPVGMFGTVHDITETKKLMDELTKTQRLESLGVLAGGLAHDFNNILSAVLGNNNLAMLLLNDGQTDKVAESLSKMEKATMRAKDLTQQLLTFSKGGNPVKRTVFVTRLLKETADFALRGTNVQCDFNIAHDLRQVEIDEGQINQVINNIVINAAQAMPDGGNIEIRAENINKSGEMITTSLMNEQLIKISITDHGPGIKEEILSKIFDPFFTTKQKGNGLGLASSYTIIKNHNGVIKVDSTPGKGATFTIYLPASLKETKNYIPGKDEPVNGHGKVLVMDDDDSIRDMTKQALKVVGYEVECAKNGEEALEIYKTAMNTEKPFSVVIMDLTVPGGMGGKEAIKILRKIDSNAKAVVFSGYSNDPILSEYRKYGFNGFLSKPFKVQEMNSLLQKIIKQN